MYLVCKRLFDISLAGLTVLVISPILICVMIALRLTGEGEIFYVQERLGLKNTRFGILKFATMLKDSPNIGTRSITLPGDPRVLPFGKFLRKTKINELPQLFNVLRGDMSIVGPRPLVPEIFEVFPPELQAHVYDSKPGLTGIGSIIFRDEESLFAETNLEPKVFYRQVIAPYKGALELWYGENRSMWTDLKIVLTTAWVILFPKSNLPNRLFKSLPQRSS